jgi:hypothetical protein
MPANAPRTNTTEIAQRGSFSLVLGAVARWRGWSEVNGLLDGVVYGAAAGLGTATGAAFTLELLVGASPVGRSPSGGATLAGVTLSGLAQGLFGAIIGAGFGAAVRLASPCGG